MKITELGSFIIPVDERNINSLYSEADVRGISTSKNFIETKANMEGVSVTAYKLVPPKRFAFVADTSRRGDKMSMAYNDSKETFLVSSISTVFEVEGREMLLSEYLYLWFLRSEFDRYARFHSWGSARETFSFSDMSRIRLPLPDIKTQQHLVDVWKGLNDIKQDNDAQAEPLMMLCMSYLRKLREEYPLSPIGKYIIPIDERNTDSLYDETQVRGIATSKKFIKTKANMEGVSVASYKLVAPNRFAFVADTSRRGDKMSLAYNDSKETFLVSSISTVFRVEEGEALIPEYLYLWFLRPEFDRYARFHSWGSARETFNFDDMCRVRIPIPPKHIQQAIVDIYTCAKECKAIAEQADSLCKKAIPALVQKGAHS